MVHKKQAINSDLYIGCRNQCKLQEMRENSTIKGEPPLKGIRYSPVPKSNNTICKIGIVII